MSGKPNTTWLNTMVDRLGSREAVTEHMQRIGGAGGKRATKPKGFAYAKLNLNEDHPAHPKNAGFKGGKLSKRK